MLLEHLGKSPKIHPSAYVAPNAIVCGDVTIGPGSRIAFGASIVAEGASVELGENCIVMENAVIRSTDKHSTRIGSHCLIGPNTHLVGCTLEDCVFVATGASIFHGAKLGYGSEVRINGVVHIRTELPAHGTVPIGWVAVGDPAKIMPPDQHDAIWAIQMPLNFSKLVYGVERAPEGQANMREITSIAPKHSPVTRMTRSSKVRSLEDSRVEFIGALHAPYTCSDEILLWAKEFAWKNNVK